MHLSVHREILDLPRAPSPDHYERDCGIFSDSETAFKLMDFLYNIVAVNEGGEEIPLRLLSTIEKMYDDFLEECLNQGIREEGKRIVARRVRTSWEKFFFKLEDDKIPLMCHIGTIDSEDDFETFLFPQRGEILVPQKVSERVGLPEDTEVFIEFKRRSLQ